MKIKVFISVILLLAFTVVSVTSSGYSYSGAIEALCSVGTSAQSCVLYCIDTDDVVYASDEHTKLPMASTTKIMTALVVLENADVGETVTIPFEAVGVEGSSAYLMKGEKITVIDLLYALMLESANDAATALAVYTGGDVDRFVAMMNDKARQIGMVDTNFVNPHGLDDSDHYSTAYDMALLCDYAMDNETFAAITASYRYETESRLFVNHNRLLKTCDGVIGGKTGFTKRSGRCLVSVARRDGVTMCAVTLNDPNDWKDHNSLYDAAFDMYGRLQLKGGEYNIPVVNGKNEQLTAVASDMDFVCEKGKADKVETKVCHDRFVYAPVKKGDTVGYLIHTVNGEEIARSEMKSKVDISQIKKKTFIEKIISFIFQD